MNEQQQISYIIGRNVTEDLKGLGIDFDIDTLLSAIKEGLNGEDFKLSPDEINAIIPVIQKTIEENKAKSAGKSAEDAAVAGKVFLEENGKKEDVITTESGLQYKVINEGHGPIPSATDMVTTHYEGCLITGQVFDSSIKRGQPATFPVNGVIQGWQEALQLMKVGAKWELYIPSDLAYGTRGAGADIGPNETLIFEIELINIA